MDHRHISFMMLKAGLMWGKSCKIDQIRSFLLLLSYILYSIFLIWSCSGYNLAGSYYSIPSSQIWREESSFMPPKNGTTSPVNPAWVCIHKPQHTAWTLEIEKKTNAASWEVNHSYVCDSLNLQVRYIQFLSVCADREKVRGVAEGQLLVVWTSSWERESEEIRRS